MKYPSEIPIRVDMCTKVDPPHIKEVTEQSRHNLIFMQEVTEPPWFHIDHRNYKLTDGRCLFRGEYDYAVEIFSLLVPICICELNRHKDYGFFPISCLFHWPMGYEVVISNLQPSNTFQLSIYILIAPCEIALVYINKNVPDCNWNEKRHE